LALTEIRTGDDQYERRIGWYIENVDRIIKSAAEATAVSVFEGTGHAGFVAGEFLTAVRPGWGLVTSMASVAMSKLLQATLISTRPDERNRLLKESIVTLIQVLAKKVIEQFGGKAAEKFANQHDENIDDLSRHSTEWVLERYFFNETAGWRR